MEKKEPRVWKLIYRPETNFCNDAEESNYEITDGIISIFSKDDDRDSLLDVVKSLNSSDCSFYQDERLRIENMMLRDDVEYLRELVSKIDDDSVKC